MWNARCAHFFVLAGLLAGSAAGSQESFVSSALMREPVVGLLALPEIFGEFGCSPSGPKRLNLYATPSKDRPPVGTIELQNPPRQPEPTDCEVPRVAVRRGGDTQIGQELPTDEMGYEIRAAVVYQRSDRWFRIALQPGSAWIERDNADGFLSYPDGLISDQFLTHLRKDWDGELRVRPASAITTPLPTGWKVYLGRDIPARVLETQSVGGETWIRVRLETEVCGVSFVGVTSIDGWLPAHRVSGATSVWFSSRGC